MQFEKARRIFHKNLFKGMCLMYVDMYFSVPLVYGPMEQHDRVIPLCRKESSLCQAVLCLQIQVLLNIVSGKFL